MHDSAAGECLLHLAVESEDAEIFDLILAYGERRSRPWSSADDKVKYPWPEQQFNNSTVWRVSFGSIAEPRGFQSTIDVSSRNAGHSRARAQF